MNSYRELEIFVESKKLAIEVHVMSLLLPKFELFETGSQVRRSSKSVPATIVEGFSRRRYKNDFIKYLIYSIAECDETLIHLDLLKETNSLQDENLYIDLRSRYVQLSKKINKFTLWVETKFIYSPPKQ